ncbi:MAG: hypothetical protein ACPGYF_07965 [Chitinophagales bacterium]
MILDLIFLGVLALFALYGFKKGLAFAIGFGIALFLAFTMTSSIVLLLMDKVIQPLGIDGYVLPSILVLGLDILVFYGLVSYLPNLLSKVIKVATLGIGNRILGVLVFTLFGALSLASLYVIVNRLGAIPPSFTEDSLTQGYLNTLSEPIYTLFERVMPESIDYLEDLTKEYNVYGG